MLVEGGQESLPGSVDSGQALPGETPQRWTPGTGWAWAALSPTARKAVPPSRRHSPGRWWSLLPLSGLQSRGQRVYPYSHARVINLAPCGWIPRSTPTEGPPPSRGGARGGVLAPAAWRGKGTPHHLPPGAWPTPSDPLHLTTPRRPGPPRPGPSTCPRCSRSCRRGSSSGGSPGG